MVRSPFLLTIQPCSTARSGKQLSSDTVLSVPYMVVEVISDSYKTSYSAAANDAARQTKPRKQFHHPVLPVARVKTEDTPDECSARSAADEDADSGGKAGKVHRNEQQEETEQSAGKKVKVLRPQAMKLHTRIDALVDIIRCHSRYRKNERNTVALTIRKIQAPNHEAAVFEVSGSPLLNFW